MGGRINLVAFAAVFLLASFRVHASDPELTMDFTPPPPGVDLNGAYFTNMNLKNPQTTSDKFATVTLANIGNLTAPLKRFDALEGLGISAALLQFPPGTVNRPHTHPRGTELLFVLEGCLDVGLLDTMNPPNLFTQTLQAGDLFVFPKGLVHFQINWGKDGKSAKALGSFSSSNAGTVMLPPTLFGSNPLISLDVLTKSFQVSPEVIKELEYAQKN